MLAGLTRIVIGLHLLFAFISLASAQGQCPNPPVPTITSSEIPTDVCIPANFNALPIDFFDDYSWRARNGLACRLGPAWKARFCEDGRGRGTSGFRDL